LKIASLINSSPLGSQTFIRREIRAIERAGVAVTRFALRGNRDALVEPADRDEFDRTEHILARPWWQLGGAVLGTMLRSPRRAIGALALLFRSWRAAGGDTIRHAAYFAEACYLARRCGAIGVDHLHVHFGTNSTTVAMICRALSGPAYSFTVHGPEEFDMPERLLLREKIARSAFVVGVSSFGRSQLYRWCAPSQWPKVKVVHCGIDIAKYGNPSGPPTPLRLLSIGRLVEQKGQLLLIEAMAMACKTYPDLHLTLVGDGVLRGVIEERIEALGLGANVTLAGWLDEGAVQGALAGTGALVLPSFAEGLPVVLMEAMASARPVIASNVAGIAELVDDASGWLVTPGDADLLATTIETFAASSVEQLTMMGLAGRKRALARHDVDRSGQLLLEYFAEADEARAG